MKEGQADAVRGRGRHHDPNARSGVQVCRPRTGFSLVHTPAGGAAERIQGFSRSLLLICLGVLGLAVVGCQTARPFPPANLQEPGWTVRQGQAVWQRPNGAPEIAGEIVVATQPGGRSFVQFSKNGFPLLTAQAQGNKWEADVPTQNKRYTGHGQPPKRLLLLYLPAALEGKPLPRGWTWTQRPDGGWRLENHGTGESLDGFFSS